MILISLELLKYDIQKNSYNLVLNDIFYSFCKKYEIQITNQNMSQNNDFIVDTSDLMSQIIQITDQTTSYFRLEFNEIVKKSEIISILTELEEKIFNLKILELSVKPEENDSSSEQDYIIQVKVKRSK